MYILELSKVLIYEFHYDCIKIKYSSNSKLLFTGTDSLMYGIKTEIVQENFSSNKEIFEFSNYSTMSKYYDDSKKLVIGKMKDKAGCVAIIAFVVLKQKMYSHLDNDSEHKKAEGVNSNVGATISHNEYEDAFLNKKYFSCSMNRIQSKDHKIETHEISKI